MPNKKRRTAASSSRAPKERRQTNPDPACSPIGATESPQGATGWSMSGAEPDRKKISQPHGGALTPHAPGSNGGVHRGPDKGIRRNVVRAIFMGALTDEGVSLENLRRRRKHRKGETLVPMAMVHHCKQAYKNIAADAALGIQEAYGPYLRMMADGHMMFQPQKDEAAEGKTPTPAMFVYSDDLQARQAIAATAPGEPDGAVRDADGQEYV